MLCRSLKVLCRSVGKQEKHMGTHAVGMLHKSCDPKVPYISHAHHYFQSFLSRQSCKLNEDKKRLTHTRHCKYTQVWCLGQLCDNEVRVFPSNQGYSGTCVNELTGYHDCYRCIALLSKYYGHQHYRIHFAHEELQCQNDDV